MTGDMLAVQKLNAALQRGYFRTMDIFAGCGGLSLGFDRAGFKCVSAIEVDDLARASHELNFARVAPQEGYVAHGDIRTLESWVAIQHLGATQDTADNYIDVIIGGPPCQPFSMLGRAALRHFQGDQNAHVNDERVTLFEYFLSYLEELKPIAFVLENVPEIGRFAGGNVAEEIAKTADEIGYEVRYALLNSVWYGVPQLRDRMIIIGINKSLNQIPQFPAIMRKYNIPTGYDSSRSSQGKVVVLEPSDHFVGHGRLAQTMSDAVTVGEAFADLPRITHHLSLETARGQRRDISIEISYTGRGNSYTKEMRRWPNFESNGHSNGHVIRYTPRDYEIFRRMPENAMYPEAVQIAEEIFQERLYHYQRQYGILLDETNPEWHKLRKETVPPYKIGRYPNKYRKMAANEPSRTVPAHLGKDTYSHIHFDSEQARAISVREAARLQSFPDAFQFVGPMNVQFTQIGNAVPPLMAYAIASQLSCQLTERI